MLKQNWLSVSRITRVFDNLVLVVTFFLAYYGRNSLIFWDQAFNLQIPFGGYELASIGSYYILLIVALPLYNILWTALGAYDRIRLFSFFRMIKVFTVSSFVVFCAIAAAIFLLKLDLSRSVIILFCTLAVLLLCGGRYLLKQILRYWLGSRNNIRNIIVVGTGNQAIKVSNELRNRPELGISFVGFVAFEKEHSSSIPSKDRVFIGAAELEDALKRYAVDEVIFTDVRANLDFVESMVILCAEQGVQTSLFADLFSVGIAKSEVSYFAGTPLIHYHTPPGAQWELTVKRVIDFIIATVLLILLAPVFLLIAVGIRVMSPGPVIFKQRRVGLNGRIFSMYKFRSMKVGAEDELQTLIDRNEMDGPVFKLKEDPRVTSFGRFLRRFSLDELPQLFNVFRGDMSLVGPRPPVPGEVSQYARRYRRRLSMRPGLTCIWQVSGRNEIRDFDTWMKLDLEYIDNWSLLMDFKILFKTIPAVVFGYGAR